MCNLSDYQGLRLVEPWKSYLKAELDEWHTSYLPVETDGSTLDIGAGCGETAFFYLWHGAPSVVAIESDPQALKCLYRNFGQDRRVLIVPLRVRTIKVDIEGSEWGMTVEAHGGYPRFKLLKSHGDGFGVYRLQKLPLWHIQLSLSYLRILSKWLLVKQGEIRRRLW